MIRIAYDSRGFVTAVGHEFGLNRIHQAEAEGGRVDSRNNWRILEHAIRAAQDATHYTGKEWFAVDKGPCVLPRYDIAQMPAVGDPVSRGFNGDYYPCGEIVRVSPTAARVVTSTGDVFNRCKQGAEHARHSATWRDRVGFALVRGHHNERNPHF